MLASKFLNTRFEEIIKQIQADFSTELANQEFVQTIQEEKDIIKFYQSKLLAYYDKAKSKLLVDLQVMDTQQVEAANEEAMKQIEKNIGIDAIA